MKIAMFTNTYLPHVGGVARSVSSFSDELRRRNHEVEIIAPQFPEAEESTEHVLRVPAIQNFNGSDFSVHLPQPGLISGRMTEFQPEVIHSHHPFLLGDSALRTAYEFGLPLVFTHHTMYEQYSHYVPLDSEALKRVAIQLATEYCNLCSHVIAPSESIADLLKNRGVTVPVTTIPTGIDLTFFGSGNGSRARRELDIAQDALVIGHVGRLAPEKRLDFLAEAVSRYLAEHPAAKFLVVGQGPSRETMTEIFQQHSVLQQVVFAGQLCGEKLADAYASMNVFGFASQSETQGMVIAEAMAAGNPVVAVDGPGIREIVSEQNGRLLGGDCTCHEFTAALTELTKDSDHLRNVGEAARESVRSYGLECCADRLIELYQTLIEDFGSNGGSDFGPWDQLRGRLEAEWKLITEKATALSAAVVDTDATKAMLV
jgi:1,2-diacylglycerol 3-alpha-glucosyltransferase